MNLKLVGVAAGVKIVKDLDKQHYFLTNVASIYKGARFKTMSRALEYIKEKRIKPL